MKKILCITLIAILMITLSACVKNQGAATSSADTPEASVSAAESDTVSPDAAGSQSSSGSIIAESSNTVSNKEVEAILDDLSGELDSAINGAESLEDLDETDLDVNNIE